MAAEVGVEWGAGWGAGWVDKEEDCDALRGIEGVFLEGMC